MKDKKTILNIITSLLNQVVSVICGFIIPRLIIKTYGSNINGLITSITQFLLYITLLESGFGPVIKSCLYKPITDKNKNEIEKILKISEKTFRTISYIFIVYIFLLCIFFSVKVGSEFDTFFTVSLVLIISISTFSEYYFGMTYKLYLQAEQSHYVVTIIQIATLILNSLIIIILIKSNVNIQIVKLVTAIIYGFRPILQNIYVKKKYNLNIKNAEDDYILPNKWDGLAQHIAYVIRNNTDVVILTLCGNLAEVSVYSVYLLVVNGVKNLIGSFTGGMESKFGVMIAKCEKQKLNKKYKKFMLYYLIVSIILTSMTMILIIPFVRVYVGNIKDVNYIRPTFAYLMVLTTFIEIIRQPYLDLIKSAGHFKQTKKWAIIEALTNIIISLILVNKLGLVGVAIGTLVAIVIRGIEVVIYASKNILK